MSLTTKEVCVCDVCGIERAGDTNHWWLLGRGVVGFWCSPWDESLAQGVTDQHLCGLTCLYKAIDKLAQKILREAVKA